MKKLSILTALLLEVAGVSLTGCEDNRGAEGPDFGTEESDRSLEQVEPGPDERTGFEEEEDTRILEDEPNRDGALEETEQEWNENVEEPVQRELNE